MLLISITAYLIIPVYTLLFAWKTDWFSMNFSVLGNLSSRKNLFLLWGIIVGIYFYYVLENIIKRLPRNKKEKTVSKTALFFLSLAVLTPYLPDAHPFPAVLHVVFSFLTSVFLIICLYMVIWKLYCMNQAVYRNFFICLNGITALSFLLFHLAGIVSTALEVFFVLSCTFLLQKLYLKVVTRKESWRRA